MKKIFTFLKWLVVVVLLIIGLAYATGYGYLVKAVRVIYLTGHKTAFLADYSYFSNKEIAIENPQPWKLSKDYNSISSTAVLKKAHQDFGTIAFLIITNDSIWHEEYFDIGSKNSRTNSFSMAKSITTSALGKAIDLKFIPGLEAKVIDYLPSISGAYAKDVTVGDLASMSSGQSWDESYYGATSLTTESYFTTDIKKLMLSIPFEKKPGQQFIYQSGDTQLLAMVLEKATGQNLSDFVSRYFWKPMGMENSGFWQLDSEKHQMEKSFCCVGASARDFARFGKLYLNNGFWNEQQILSSDYIQKSITPRFKNSPQYGYGWWINNYKGNLIFSMNGHLGQYVLVLPEKNTIIVRLGHRKGKRIKDSSYSEDYYLYIDQALEMLKLRKE